VKIDNNSNINAEKIANYYQNMQKNQNQEEKKVQSDKMQISDSAKEIVEAKKELENRPEVRSERVAALKEKVNDGTYTVDSSRIAAKILSNLE